MTKKTIKQRDLPVILWVPFHHVTLGIGLPPPDSQVSVRPWPSLKGPIVEVLSSSVPSSLVIRRYSGLTVTKQYQYHNKISNGKRSPKSSLTKNTRDQH